MAQNVLEYFHWKFAGCSRRRETAFHARHFDSKVAVFADRKRRQRKGDVLGEHDTLEHAKLTSSAFHGLLKQKSKKFVFRFAKGTINSR